MEWAILPLKKYADFTGRARRKEFWLYVLLNIGIMIVTSILDGVLCPHQTAGKHEQPD